MNNLHDKGIQATIRHLEDKGYEILERKYTCSVGSMDIIAIAPNNSIAFIEVKTRTNLEQGLPADRVIAKKRKKYECIAAIYLRDTDYINMSVRFDTAGVLVINGDKALIRYHTNTFGVV